MSTYAWTYQTLKSMSREQIVSFCKNELESIERQLSFNWDVPQATYRIGLLRKVIDDENADAVKCIVEACAQHSDNFRLLDLHTKMPKVRKNFSGLYYDDLPAVLVMSPFRMSYDGIAEAWEDYTTVDGIRKLLMSPDAQPYITSTELYLFDFKEGEPLPETFVTHVIDYYTNIGDGNFCVFFG